jgi:hypothetical protein
MVIELRGNQIRIRVKDPAGATDFGTQDVGMRGRLQRVAALYPGKGWRTQAWRLNLRDYASYSEVVNELKKLRAKKQITKTEYNKASILAFRWFNTRM